MRIIDFPGGAVIAGAIISLLSAPAPNAQARDVIYNVEIETPYSRVSVGRATQDGALVEIYGLHPEDAEDAADNLKLPGWFTHKPFILTGFDPEDDRADRIVLFFGPHAPSFDRICQGPPRSRLPIPDDRVPGIVTAAFCDGFEYESRAVMRSDNLDDPTSPAFARSMRRLLKEILPRENYERQHDRRDGRRWRF